MPPIGAIAEQRGHADTRMTEKPHAPVPSYVAARISQCSV